MKDVVRIGIIGAGFARTTQIPGFKNCEGARGVVISVDTNDAERLVLIQTVKNSLLGDVTHGELAAAVKSAIARGFDVPAPEVVFVDPPRAGLSQKAVRRVLELAPERISYVSCHPTTLAPNARQLVEGGYRLQTVQPVDMFPHTHHIECVAAFTRL